MRLNLLFCACALFIQTSYGADGALWREPAPMTNDDWVYGPGGQDKSPQPPFEFIKEDKGGTTPKVVVKDARGNTFSVKFGPEVNGETFVPRLAKALGYYADATYFVPSGTVAGAQKLGRAKSFIDVNGKFHDARFKLSDSNLKYTDQRGWSWVSNPFVGTHELNGLRILMLLTSNWDAKDSRDGDLNSNNAILRAADNPNSPLIYEVDDWGSAMGKWGGFFRREKWDCQGFLGDSDNFLKGMKADGSLQWGFGGKHAGDMTKGITADDIRWLLPYLDRITDEQWEAGLKASGGSETDVNCFIRSLKNRVAQLKRATNTGR